MPGLCLILSILAPVALVVAYALGMRAGRAAEKAGWDATLDKLRERGAETVIFSLVESTEQSAVSEERS